MDMYQKRKIRAEKNNRNNEKDEKNNKKILTGIVGQIDNFLKNTSVRFMKNNGKNVNYVRKKF